jgi:hypothetical protein
MTDEEHRQQEREAREDAERRLREAQAEERRQHDAKERGHPHAEDDDDWDPRRTEERQRP